MKKGTLCVRKTKNNMFVCLLNEEGNVIFSSSGGRILTGKHRHSNIAGEELGIRTGKACKLLGYTVVNLLITGVIIRQMKDLMREIVNSGIEFKFVFVRINKAHNGVRHKKLRRK